MARPSRLGLILAAALGACRPAPPPPASEFEVLGPAVSGKPTAVALLVASAPGAEVSLTADMDMPGMTPVVAKASETAPGRYEGALTWTMPGDWSVFSEARWPDGRRLERRDPVRVAPR